MAYIYLLHISSITLIILLSISVSRCDDAKYRACSIPYSCMDSGINNVSYPFWGDDRPKFCGIPDLKLKCNKKDDKYYTSIDVSQSGYIPLKVVGIDKYSHTVNVSLDNVIEICHHFDKAIAFLPILKLSPGYRNITLQYGCSSKCESKYNMSVGCINNTGSAKVTAYYFSDTSCLCKNNFTFPVDKRALDEINDGSKNASLRSILQKWSIIQMKYTTNFSAACFKCEQSGGSCGSPENSDSLSDNKFKCYCPNGTQQPVCPRKSDKNKKLGIILGLLGGGCAFVLVAITTIWCCIKKRHSEFLDRGASFDCSASELEKGSKYYGVPLFSYRELAEATDNFDKELGSGGFGTVYHGKLNDGREVAVKRLYEKNYKRLEQFMNEVQILTRLRHDNLVSLYGCTSQHCRELLLVYQYVQNGTVADQLFGKDTKSLSSPLPWPIRLRIAIETATALSYLHASDIIHRDVKTNNILLDSNFSVKVADFGLSRLFPTDATHVSTAPQGTPGYLDPEYHQCYQLTDKSDVYSFGVVLVELISSLPAIDMNRHRHEINLSNYAINRIKRCAFDELVDSKLGFASDFKVRRMTISVAELAFQCLQHDKGFRPSMDEVLEVLKRIQSADYDTLLQAENMNEIFVQEVAKLHSSNLLPPPPPPPLSPTENDHVQLLRSRQLQPPSPVSVIVNWVSTSTTPNTSK